jgi:hypothetical protein
MLRSGPAEPGARAFDAKDPLSPLGPAEVTNEIRGAPLLVEDGVGPEFVRRSRSTVVPRVSGG